MNENEIQELVSRVSREVISEVNNLEARRGISVNELRDRATELGGGSLDAAWTISYSTSDAQLIERLDAGSIRDAVAWTISYSTASNSIVSALDDSVQ